MIRDTQRLSVLFLCSFLLCIIASRASAADFSQVIFSGDFQCTRTGASDLIGVSASNPTQWKPIGGLWPFTDPNGGRSEIASMEETPYGLLISGDFQVNITFNGRTTSLNNVAIWEPKNSTWFNLDGGIRGTVNVARYNPADSCVYVGGAFLNVGSLGIPANRIARWCGRAGWQALGSGVGGNFTTNIFGRCFLNRTDIWDNLSHVRTLELFVGGELVAVGGLFSHAGGLASTSLAVFDVAQNQWAPVPLKFGSKTAIASCTIQGCREPDRRNCILKDPTVFPSLSKLQYLPIGALGALMIAGQFSNGTFNKRARPDLFSLVLLDLNTASLTGVADITLGLSSFAFYPSMNAIVGAGSQTLYILNASDSWSAGWKTFPAQTSGYWRFINWVSVIQGDLYVMGQLNDASIGFKGQTILKWVDATQMWTPFFFDDFVKNCGYESDYYAPRMLLASRVYK